MNRFEKIANNIVAEVPNGFTIPLHDPKYRPLISKFNGLRWSLRDYGAFEHNVGDKFWDIMKRAAKHMSFPNMKPEDWGLDTGTSKWQYAAQKLTEAAKNIFWQLRNAPEEEIQAVADYYGEGRIARIAGKINEKTII